MLDGASFGGPEAVKGCAWLIGPFCEKKSYNNTSTRGASQTLLINKYTLESSFSTSKWLGSPCTIAIHPWGGWGSQRVGWPARCKQVSSNELCMRHSRRVRR